MIDVENQRISKPLLTSFPAPKSTALWERHNTIEKTMGRIQRHALNNRIRTEEFFKDFDTLKCGNITAEQFRRGLDAFGVSGIHHLYLSEKEIEDLLEAYKDLNDPNYVCWKVFENDVDLIFTTKNLEKYPNLRVECPEDGNKYSLPRGNFNWNSVRENLRSFCEDTIQNIKEKINKRRLNPRPYFKDYDRLNNGHVTPSQFRQCLIHCGLLCSPEEIKVLEKRYSDDIGFNYVWFLKEVEPKAIEYPLYDDFIKEKIELNSRKIFENPTNKEKDIAAIIAKIKAKVVTEGIRPLDFFIDYDQLNKQIISRENFERALSLCCLGLSKTEVNTIMDIFASPIHIGYIDYHRFCLIVESACAVQGLEKKPLFVPVKHIPLSDLDYNFLNAEERTIIDNTLLSLASKCIYDQNLLPCFQDFDPPNCGSISYNNFLRVLALRKMTDHLSSKQLEVLAKCFRVKRGTADEIDYRAFCACLDTLAKIHSRKVT